MKSANKKSYICDMKRLSGIILIVIFLCASCGTTLHYNYKHGRLAKLAFWFNDANKCIKHGCQDCHTEYELVIMKTDQIQVNNDYTIPIAMSFSLAFDTVPSFICVAPAIRDDIMRQICFGPPELPDDGIVVRNCRLTI